MTKCEGISVRAFAKTMGVDEKAVRQKVKNGRLAEAVLPDGSLDEPVARALWFTNTDTSKQRMRERDKPQAPKLTQDAEEGLKEYQIKLERMQVALEVEQINLKKLKENTVDLTEAKRAVRSLMRIHRDAMLNFANRYGPAIAAKLGVRPAELVGELDARIRDALVEAANAKLPFTMAPPDLEEPEESAEAE